LRKQAHANGNICGRRVAIGMKQGTIGLALIVWSSLAAAAEIRFPGPALGLSLAEAKALTLPENPSAQLLCSDDHGELEFDGRSLREAAQALDGDILCSWFKDDNGAFVPARSIIANVGVNAPMLIFSAPTPGAGPILREVIVKEQMDGLGLGALAHYRKALAAMTKAFGRPEAEGEFRQTWINAQVSASIDEEASRKGVMLITYRDPTLSARDVSAASAVPTAASEGEIQALLVQADALIEKLHVDPSFHKRAGALLEEAAALGSDEAKLKLGDLYDDEPATQEQARALYQELADKGSPAGMYNHGLMFWAVDMDMERALPWFERAAERGDADAMEWLSRLYHFGNNVTQSDTRSEEWLQRAAEAGSPAAMTHIGIRHHKSGNHELARKYLFPAMEAESPDSYLIGGYLHHYGKGGPVNFEKAIDAYQRSHEPVAYYLLAAILDESPGYVDPLRAAEKLLDSLREDVPQAQKALAAGFAEWSSETRMALQQLVQDAGFYNGAIDGDIGPGSRAAIANFLLDARRAHPLTFQ
jgi:TPR repeat protein